MDPERRPVAELRERTQTHRFIAALLELLELMLLCRLLSQKLLLIVLLLNILLLCSIRAEAKEYAIV